jgi:integrase
MPLTAIEIKEAKAEATQYKMTDGEGMFLLVKPNGGKYWQLKYRYNGKEKLISLGVFPKTSLKEARNKRAEVKKLLSEKIDPSAERKMSKQQLALNHENNFKAIAVEWHELQKDKWTPKHAKTVLTRLEKDTFPALGDRPIKDITAQEILAMLKKIEARGAIDLAHRAQQTAGQILRYAISTGRAQIDVTINLRGALKTQKKKSHAYLKADELPTFLAKLDEYDTGYDGDKQTQIATKLLLLTFVRTGELRGAKWSEINFEEAEWRIPPERMKMRELHIVPLSKQALSLFEEMRHLSGNYEHVFPNRSKPMQVMSENTILFSLYRMGYRSRTTAHGFRATASTILNEKGFNKDHVEVQLSHGERDQVRGSYNHALYLDQRKVMMQWWADYLDGVRK